MKTGPEMDAEIARRVFGYRAFVDDVGAHQIPPGYGEMSEWCPPYSTTIKAAWLVVEHLTFTDGPHADMKFSFGLEFSTVIDWSADFTPRRNHPQARDYEAFCAHGYSAPEAICRAALRVVGDPAPPAGEQEGT